MFETTDPFTMTQDLVWDALVDSTPLSMIVKPGNRIGVTTKSYAQPKENPNDRDFPEYQLTQRAFNHSPISGNSKAADFGISFLLLISSGKLNAETMNKVVWLATKALSKKGSSLGRSDYIKQWGISEPTNTSLTSTQSENGLLGWTALMVVSVVFCVTRDELSS